MRILTKPSAIRNAILGTRPSQVAVAYVGWDWKSFFGDQLPNEIILSPTFGSNPYAIEQMMEEMGEQNVYFLERLHAKIFIGSESALVGSCNLTRNGLADDKLYEVAAIVTAPMEVAELGRTFERFKELASIEFRDKKSKVDKIRELKELWRKGIVAGIVGSNAIADPSDISEAVQDIESIRISWYHGGADPDIHIDKVVRKSRRAMTEDDLEDYLYFKESDDIKEGDWHLFFQCRADGMPRKNGDVGWMYAHYVVPNGVSDPDFPSSTSLVIQAKGVARPSPPFTLTQDVKAEIRALLMEEKYREFLSMGDSEWDLPDRSRTQNFIHALKQRVRKRNL